MTHAPSTGLPDFNLLWDYGQPAETEARFRELLPAARACGDRDYYLQLLTQIARAQGLQKRFEQAHATLDHVREGMALINYQGHPGLTLDLMRAGVLQLDAREQQVVLEQVVQ